MSRSSLVVGVLAAVAVAVADGVVYFREEFANSGALDRWVMSAHKGDQQGKFELSYGKWAGDVQKDIGLRTTEDARFYGASARIEPAFSNKDKTLVVQFSVKHEQNIDCGGGYIKLFDCSLDQANMHGDSPYLIMFGPDICGPGTKKVHAIITYRGKNHLINKEIKCKDDIYTHLYTFILRPDQTYEIRIDNEKVESGELEKDWEFLPSPKIKDPEAKKPEDWDDREEIDDPADTKPDDWDLPEFISDPEAKRPEDWDEEMDGEWEPPQIANPDFKGEWKPKKIENPDFQGVWVHPMIDNPLYEPDNEIYAMKEICHVGVDVWQVKSGSIFDNILITDDPDFAREFGEETWGLTKAEEKRAKEQYDEEERVKKDEAAVKERNESEKKNQDASDDEDEPDHDEL